MKGILRYPGGKTRAIKYLNKFIPPDTKKLVSPFFGGGSFELNCITEHGMKVYAADAFYPLVFFWQHLLADNDELVKIVSTFLPAVSKEHYIQMQKELPKLKSSLEVAAYYFVLNRCSFSGNISGGFTSYQMENTGENPRFNKKTVERLRNYKALQGKLIVKKIDFSGALAQCPEEYFTYLDPPYLIDNKIYGARGDKFHQIDHEKLRNILQDRQGRWLLSYNDCPKIRELYKDFCVLDDGRWAYGMNKNKESKELLILSPALSEILDIK